MKKGWTFFNKLFSFLFHLFLLGFILLFAWLHLFGNNETQDIQIRTVLTGSMSKSIKPGSLIVTKKIDASSIKVGDIIAFDSNNEVVTHRVNIVEKKEGNLQFVTKGDSNNFIDAEKVAVDQLQGRVLFSVPVLGHFLLITQTQAGKAALLLTIIDLLLLEYFVQMVCQMEDAYQRIGSVIK